MPSSLEHPAFKPKTCQFSERYDYGSTTHVTDVAARGQAAKKGFRQYSTLS